MIDGSFFAILFALIIVLVICSCRKAQDDEARASEELPAYRRQRQQQRRQSQADQGQESQDPAEDRRRREAVVKSSLFSRKLGEGESINSLSSILSAASERYKDDGKATTSNRDNFLVRSLRSASSSVQSHHGRSKADCSICLDKYEAGDTVSWAKTDGCDHLYHQECIVEWLRGHDDCPLCRAKLVDEEGQEQEEDSEIEEGV